MGHLVLILLAFLSKRIECLEEVSSPTNVSDTPLKCYYCEPSSGVNCSDLVHNEVNTCTVMEPYCKVKRVEYLLTGTEVKTFTPWSLERSCSNECKNFCVTMGARTKVTYCTSCCNTDLCNTDNYSQRTYCNPLVLLFIFLKYIL